MTPKDVAPHVHVTVRVVPLPAKNVLTTVHIDMRVRKAIGVAGPVATQRTIAPPDSPPPLDTGVR